MENHTALTEDELGYPGTTKSIKARHLYDIMIPLLGLFIITINLAVVISSGLILKRRKEPRSTYMLLGNIALADLMTGIQVVVGQVSPYDSRSHLTCIIFIGTILTTTIASVYSVLLIAIERYLYILHGLKYKIWITPRRMWQLIGIIWIFSILLGFLPIMVWNNPEDSKVCWFVLLAPPYLLLFTALLGCVPVFVVCVLYSIILYRAIKKVIHLNSTNEDQENIATKKLRTFRGRPNLEQTNSESSVKRTGCIFMKLSKKMSVTSDVQYSNNVTKWKAIKVVLFTTLSFVVTLVPYLIACIMYFSCNSENSPNLCEGLIYAIASPLSVLGFMNSLLNPLIYAWWHNGFRNSVKRIYCMNNGNCKCHDFFMRIQDKIGSNSNQNIDTSKNIYTVSSNVL